VFKKAANVAQVANCIAFCFMLIYMQLQRLPAPATTNKTS